MPDELSSFMILMHKIMHYIPHILIVLSICSWIIIAHNSEYYTLRSLLIFIPLILTSLFLILKKNLHVDNSKNILNINSNILTKIIIIFISLQYITALCASITSPVFPILTISIYTLILFQIISKSPKSSIILVEIIITTLILILSQQLGTALWIGDVDLVGHYTCAEHIVETGIISSEFYTEYIGGVWKDYNTFCLYHILIVIGILAFGLAPNVSLYLVSIIATLISVFFVYKFTRYFFNSSQAALLATLFYSIMPCMLAAFLNPAPRVMASVAFLIVLYIVFVHFPKYRKASCILLLILLCYTALVHHAQHLFILATLILLILGSIMYYQGERRQASVPFIVLAFISLITLLIGYGDTLTSILKDRLFKYIPTIDAPIQVISPNPSTSTIVNDVASGSPEIILYSEPNTIIQTIAYTLPVSIMMVFCLIGIYYAVTKAVSVKKIGIITPLLLMLFIPFLNGLLDIFPMITSSLQIYRFRILIAPIFAMVMGVGCSILINGTKKRMMNVGIIVILSLVFIIGTLSISGMIGNDMFNDEKNNNIIPKGGQSYFIEPDLTTITWIDNSIENINQIRSDREIGYYLFRTDKKFTLDSINDISLFELMKNSQNKEHTIKYIFIPEHELIKYQFKPYISTAYNEAIYQYPFPEISLTFEKYVPEYNVIYTNHYDRMYYQPLQV